MSPVVACHGSPRETLNSPWAHSGPSRQTLSRKVLAADSSRVTFPLSESHLHSNSDPHMHQKKPAKSPLKQTQLQHSRLHKSQPQLVEAKHRKVSDPGKTQQCFPRWTDQIKNCPNLTTESWFPLNEECWGTLKDKRKSAGTPKHGRHQLTKSRSQSSDQDPWQPMEKYRGQSIESWYPRDKCADRRVSQVWFPRDTISRSSRNLWYPIDRTQFYSCGPWYPLAKSDHSYSQRELSSGFWNSEGPRCEPPVPVDSWYQCYAEGLHHAYDPPRPREALHPSPRHHSPLKFVPPGSCRIPRASVRLPRKNSRRSISSSAIKHERGSGAPCPGPGNGGGRCGALTKAYSTEGNGPHYGQQPSGLQHHQHHHGTHHHQRRPQVLSQSSLSGGRRVGAVDDSGGGRAGERWGRRGNTPTAGQGYELSQDLADKRIEMLERRYGGDQARRAATTIQRAYRHYAMTKKFRAITATAKAQERRLSRRFTVESPPAPPGAESGTPAPAGAPSSAGTNGAGPNGSCVHYRDPEQFIRSEFDQLNRNLTASVYGEARGPRPARSLSMRDNPRPGSDGAPAGTDQPDNAQYCRDAGVEADTSEAKQPPTSSSSSNNANLTISITNSTTSSDDTGIVCNTTLDSSCTSPKDLKYFSSEDSGFGSHDSGGRGSGSLGVTGPRSRVAKGKKLPPEVPRRSSSIKSSESGNSADSFGGYPLNSNVSGSRFQWPSPTPSCLTPPPSHPSDRLTRGRERSHSVERGVMRRCADSGSLSSVQSSGSDSSLSQSASDRATPLSGHDHPDLLADLHMPTSPVWKRKNQMSTSELIYDDKRLSNISENSEDSCQSHSSDRLTYSQTAPSHNNRYPPYNAALLPKVPEVLRKRQYRVGLNLFNKKPERGISYLIGRYFLENSPLAVAKFLLTRKGLSKQMIGEYLGNLQNSFNMAVLEMFSQEIDLSGMQVDVALRKYQTYFRLPGEAQKIERLMQVFAERYCQCNRDIVAKLRDPETIFVLAFAIIMLNTDLHTASMKQEKRMKIEDFVKNLRGVDDGYDIEKEMLEGMYHRIKAQEYRTGHDHVTQVMKVQQTMVEKRPNLALPHRRLVCYCRLYEVPDSTKKERVGLHQREVFLFNDLLVVTKIFSKKKNSVTYSFRQSFPLAGLSVVNKETQHYQFLIEIKQRVDNKLLIAFNARNEHDRTKFCEDLKESVSEMDEMENLRIEGELEKNKASLRASRPTSTAENRDSGVADMEVISTGSDKSTLNTEGVTGTTTLGAGTLKRTTLSNSLIDMHEAGDAIRGAAPADAPAAGGSLSSAGFLGSVGSLDSGMSVSMSGGVCSRSLGPEGCSVESCGAGAGGRPVMTTSTSLGDIRKAARRTLPSVSSLGGYGGVVLHMLRRTTKSPVPQGVNI